MIRENILAIQSSFALELYIPFNAIKIYTKSVFDALNDKDISLIRFYRNEL